MREIDRKNNFENPIVIYEKVVGQLKEHFTKDGNENFKMPKILISFVQEANSFEDNLASLDLMKKLNQIYPCSFVSSVFYDLAEKYVALDWNVNQFNFIDENSSTESDLDTEPITIGTKRKLEENDHIAASGDSAKKSKLENSDEKTNTFPAYQLPKILNFKDQKYKFETEKFLIDKYSYAYLYHLQDTKEYLGKALLVMHNL